MSDGGRPADPLARPDDLGRHGVVGLKGVWSRWDAAARGMVVDPAADHRTDRLILHAIGIGLEQAIAHLGTRPTFEAFEDWIDATTGGIDATVVARLNAALTGDPPPEETRRTLAAIDAMAPVLGASDLAQWEELGYVVVADAIGPDECAAVVDAICRHRGVDLADPGSWYAPNDHGIMVQLFQHPSFEAARRSPRIHKAFAQLWGTNDLWVSTDRVGFNPPERPGHRFRGPDLHWDVSLSQPIPLGTQGLVYLTDTEAEQGALTLVPGFHRRIGPWLDALPPGAEPRQQDLHAAGSVPVPGRAGDLVIWHQALPHGSRPNRTARPRLVQYVNRCPIDAEEHPDWR